MTQYLSLKENLIYLWHARPAIAHAVSVVSQFMNGSRDWHMQTIDKIVQYSKSILGKWLLLRKEDTLEIYNDANYDGSIIDRKIYF